MEKIKQPRFKFSRYIITKSSINLKEEFERNKSHYNFSITPRGIKNGKEFKLIMDSSITSEYSNIELEIIGYFEFEDNIPIEECKGYFTLNAPAIIFPYIRAYISALSALSGGDTINIPTLNLTGLKDILNESIIEEKNTD